MIRVSLSRSESVSVCRSVSGVPAAGADLAPRILTQDPSLATVSIRCIRCSVGILTQDPSLATAITRQTGYDTVRVMQTGSVTHNEGQAQTHAATTG